MSYASARDKHTAEDVIDNRGQMCAAHNCPNRWSIQSSKLCTAHHWAEPHSWPRITEEQQHAETDRIIENQRPRLVPKPLSVFEKTAILRNLRSVLALQKVGAPL